MALSEFKGHKCRQLSTCPVCADALFHSSQPYRVRPGVPEQVSTHILGT